jgi:hypothetical protein
MVAMTDLSNSNAKDAEKRAVEAVIRANYNAFTTRVTDDGAEYAAEGVTIWDVFEPELIIGIDARKAFQRRDIDQSVARGALTFDVTIQLITLHGDVAISRHHVDFNYEPPNAVSGHVRVTQVLQKFDSQWKIIHTQEGVVPTGVPEITQ